MSSYNLPIVIEKDPDGYVVSCPTLQGCATQGATYEEAMQNIEDAVRLHIEDRLIQNEVISRPENVSISLLNCTVE